MYLYVCIYAYNLARNSYVYIHIDICINVGKKLYIFILWPVFQRSYSDTCTRNLLSLIDDSNYGIGKRERESAQLLIYYLHARNAQQFQHWDEEKKYDFPSTNKNSNPICCCYCYCCFGALACVYVC